MSDRISTSLCRLGLLSGLLVALVSCKQQSGAQQPAGRAAGQADATAGSRRSKQTVRSLLKERGRAELRADGLFIDLGTTDQYKYLQRHITGGWGRSGKESGTDFISVDHDARMVFHEEQLKLTHLLIRARSATKGHKLCVLVDNEPVPCQTLGATWVVLKFPVQPALGPVVRSLELLTPTPLQVDWIWLNGRSDSQPPLERLATLDLGGARQALIGDPPRSYSFYLLVPPRAALVFAYGARDSTRFFVKVARDRLPTRRVFSATAQGSRWRQARIDLKSFAGQVVRLDLITRSLSGRRAASGAQVQAGWAEPAIVLPGAPAAVPGIAPEKRPKGMIHIVLDACRRDALGPFNHGSVVQTPALDRLAERSVVFTRAYGHASWAVPEAGSVLSGRYPTGRHGLSSDRPALLPEHLQKYKFRTAYFAGRPAPPGHTTSGRGWDHFRAGHLDAEQLYAGALAWLEQNKGQAFFLQIQPMEAHEPYRSSKELEAVSAKDAYKGPLPRVLEQQVWEDLYSGRIKVTDADITYIRAMYHQGLQRHDIALGRFLKGLQRLGLRDETMITFTSNYGQELFDHGKIGNGRTLYEEIVRVPLLIHYPKIFPREVRIAEVVELVDLVPTELELLGLPPLPGVEGVSLRKVIAGQPADQPGGYAVFVDADVGVRIGALKLIRSWMTPNRNREQLFILSDDPEERRDRRLVHPIALRLAQVHLGEAFSVPDKQRRLGALGDGPRPLPGPPPEALDAKPGK